MNTKDDDMAGSVSEPKGGAPEVKPAKSLWPRPHDTVKIEPSMEPPVVDVPVEPPVGAIAAGAAAAAVPVAETVASETVLPPDAITVEPALDRVEPVVETPAAVPAADIESMVVSEPEPLRVTEDDRTDAVLAAAAEPTPPLAEPKESGPSRFIAMAAGIIVALALGAAGLVYGASGLGLFGDKKVVASSAPTPAATPVAVVKPDDLKAARQEIEDLRARLDKAEAEKNAALDKAAAAEKGRTSVPPPAPERTAAIPTPVPVPAPPVATPSSSSPTPAPGSQAVKPASASSSTPAATTANTAPSTPARSEPTPVPATPPAAKPKPAETARVETQPPAPVQTPPTYQPPSARQTSPEMPLLQGWAVRDVYNGVAVVQSGRGVPMEVQAGDELPGGNRVLAIRRLGGEWAVITEFGIIARR